MPPRMFDKAKPLCLLGVLALTSVACVSRDRYDVAVAQTESTRAQMNKVSAELGRSYGELSKTNEELERSRAEVRRLEAMIAETSQSADRDQQSSATRIAELRRRIDDLKLAQAAAENRAALFRDLARKLKDQVDAGDLFIIVRDGRMVLQLPNDVLFDTGKTELKPAGEKALGAIAGVLASMPDRQFQVAGHTDDVPIRTERFPSNWELSTGRALRVVHFLVGKGVPPATLSAAGYAEMDPVGPNTSPEARKRNRRTEITLQPNIDELVHVP